MWQLDAYEPKDLLQRIEDAIRSEIDLDLLKQEQRQAIQDQARLTDLREDIEKYLEGIETNLIIPAAYPLRSGSIFPLPV